MSAHTCYLVTLPPLLLVEEEDCLHCFPQPALSEISSESIVMPGNFNAHVWSRVVDDGWVHEIGVLKVDNERDPH